MAIVQISKLIHRTGDLGDLPQLEEGELGFATDSKQLFIGNDSNDETLDTYGKKHTEILTGESPLYFSQFAGSQDTNLNIANTVNNGQLLVATGTTSWTNRGGDAGGIIDLGHSSNVKLQGGLPGHVLQTDGSGKLTWTTNGVLRYEIASISSTDPAIVTIKTTDVVTGHNLTTGSAVTIVGVVSDGSPSNQFVTSGVDGTNKFFARYETETTFSLWLSPSTTSEPVDGSSLYSIIPDTGTVIGYIVDPTGATPLGANTTIQFNDAGSFGGSNKFTFDKVTGNVGILGSLTASNVTANLRGDGSGLANLVGANVSGEVGFAEVANSVSGANVSGVVSLATTAYSVNGANVSGEVSFANVANHVTGANVSGNVASSLVAYSVSGANVSGEVSFANVANHVAGANVSGAVSYATWANGVSGTAVSGTVGTASIALSVDGPNVSGQVANALVSGTVYTNAQPNITSVGTLANLRVGNTSTASQVDLVQILSSTNKLYVSTDTNGVSMLTRTNQSGSGLYFLDSSRYVMVMIANATTGAATTVATFQGGGLSVTGQVAAASLSGPLTGNVTASTVSTSKSMQLAVYADATARDAAITAPTAGLMVFNTAGGKFQGYDGTAWVDLN